MPSKGYIWDDEYRERYYASPKVQVHLETFKTLVKAPKSKETKDKMSAAKKDVSKPQEQKDKMAETQRLRHKLRADVAVSQPDLTKQEQWAVVKEMMKEIKDGS